MGYIRHPYITLCLPEPTSSARSTGFSCPHVTYSTLPVGMRSFMSHSVGETGVPTSVKGQHKILSKTV